MNLKQKKLIGAKINYRTNNGLYTNDEPYFWCATWYQQYESSSIYMLKYLENMNENEKFSHAFIQKLSLRNIRESLVNDELKLMYGYLVGK